MARFLTKVGKVIRNAIALLRLSDRIINFFSDENSIVLRNPFVKIGRHSYGITGCTILGATEKAPVTIGNFCSIADGVRILGHFGHPTNLPSTFPFRSRLFRHTRYTVPDRGNLNHDAVSRGPIHIGHDVWIGLNAIILPGLSIGSGAIIGAGAVVTKDIPPYAIAAGNPARVVRFRFNEALISALLESKWWELSDDLLENLDPSLYSRDITTFVEMVAQQRTASE
jgi:acetyltransferase-like isoleucine patch superfamily enzyme